MTQGEAETPEVSPKLELILAAAEVKHRAMSFETEDKRERQKLQHP